MNVEQGVAYRDAAQDESLPAGVLPIDAVFTPVRKANFYVEKVRVGQGEEMERLIVEVWTDRAMSPLDALQAAANELTRDLYLVVGASENPVDQGPKFPGVPVEKLNMRVEELGLSAHTRNALRRSGYNRAIDILSVTDAELMRIKNFGKTSMAELKERLAACGLVVGGDEAEEPGASE